MSAPAAIIFTDLDGTLLDHDTYGYGAAVPALEAIRARGLPLVFATSKTLAEAAALAARLRIHAPLIVENGCAICYPPGGPGPRDAQVAAPVDGYAVVHLCPGYGRIVDFVERQRSRHGWRLRGFNDMSAREVARVTGLDARTAAMAKQRLCDEPFEWLDTDINLGAFCVAAKAEGIQVTHGGRFGHLIGSSDKGKAAASVLEAYRDPDGKAPLVIAAGDSANDIPMLQLADIAVVVRRHDGTWLEVNGRSRTLRTPSPGPAGWNEALLQVLDTLQEHDDEEV